MSDPSYKFKESFNTLLLPIPSDRVSVAIKAAWDSAQEHGWPEEMAAETLIEEIDAWDRTGQPSDQLFQVITDSLNQCPALLGTNGTSLSVAYFAALNRLAPLPQHLLEARVLLSRLDLIAKLTSEETMSYAGVSTFLERRLGLSVSWKKIKTIVISLGLSCELKEDKVQKLLKADEKAQDDIFADASLNEACDIIAERATLMGYQGNAYANIHTLFEPEQFIGEEIFYPYHQLILYASVIEEFWDHPPQFLYVFSPRGVVATSIFEKYDVATGNPILNNFKALDELGPSWAAARDDFPFQAEALVQLMLALDKVRYEQRKQISAMLRALCFRELRLLKPIPTTVPFNDKIDKLVDQIGIQNTATRGVLEQRLVDAIGATLHNGEVMKGISDSVYATNLSRKKFGDCEFFDSEGLCSTSYEAHGGELTSAYAAGHINTIARIVPYRKKDLQLTVDPKKWTHKIIFVAHKITATNLAPQIIDGLKFEFEQITFEDFIVAARKKLSLFKPSLQKYLVQAINSPRTPQSVRLKAKVLMAR